MEKLKIGIVFGGKSTEHDVSLISATSVIKNMDPKKYDIITIGITKMGEWLLYTGDQSLIADGAWQSSGRVKKAFIAPDPTIHGIVAITDSGYEIIKLDAAFGVLHGKNGEDGTIQGLFELAGIPYVGSGVLGSSVCMDKVYTKIIMDHAGIKQAKWDFVHITEFEKGGESIISRIESGFGYPVFVKPANAGSSVGITKAKDRDSLEKALRLAFEHDRKAVIEEFISGQEVEVAVLGNDEPIASICGEIVPCNEFYDYNAKYIDNKSELHIPARIEGDTSELIRKIAVKAYKAAGCEGMARVDFFVARDGGVLLNEINTIPGFTSISMYPKLFEASGIAYSELIDRLIGLAIERNKRYGG